MNQIELKALAKINLGLDERWQRSIWGWMYLEDGRMAIMT